MIVGIAVEVTVISIEAKTITSISAAVTYLRSSSRGGSAGSVTSVMLCETAGASSVFIMRASLSLGARVAVVKLPAMKVLGMLM
jgi:hypothetical protein